MIARCFLLILLFPSLTGQEQLTSGAVLGKFRIYSLYLASFGKYALPSQSETSSGSVFFEYLLEWWFPLAVYCVWFKCLWNVLRMSATLMIEGKIIPKIRRCLFPAWLCWCAVLGSIGNGRPDSLLSDGESQSQYHELGPDAWLQ